MSAQNKTFSRVAKPQGSAESSLSHSPTTQDLSPCPGWESRPWAAAQLLFALPPAGPRVPPGGEPLSHSQVFPGSLVIPGILLCHISAFWSSTGSSIQKHLAFLVRFWCVFSAFLDGGGCCFNICEHLPLGQTFLQTMR